MLIESIQKIKESIIKWDQVRNTDIGLNFLTSGLGFSITRKEYDRWLEIDTHTPIKDIHLYIGVVEFEMVFYIVDSASDKLGNREPQYYNIGNNLFIKEVTKNITSSINTSPINNLSFPEKCDQSQYPFRISEKEVMKRLFKWYLNGTAWFDADRTKNQVAAINGEQYGGIVKCMSIPFCDLKYLFSNYDQDFVFAFFALRDEKPSPIHNSESPVELIELILCAGKMSAGPGNASQVTLEYFADVTRPSPPFTATGFNLFNV